MTRKKVFGKCHVCSTESKLSFEHVPPKKAFNKRRVVKVSFDDAVHLGPDQFPRGPIEQRGAGEYTLCENCNNKTGGWYGKAFVDWCYQGANVLLRTGFEPRIFTLHYLLPLRVIKQITTMFFSVNTPEFGKAHPKLVEFVLNKERRYLPPEYRFFIYFNRGGLHDRFRYSGVSGSINLDTGRTITLSEITFPPFGYVMTLGSEPPDRRLLEITHFSTYGYNEFKILELRPPVLDTPTYFPGDYRTQREFREQVAASEAVARS